jgi:VWFA-related protein
MLAWMLSGQNPQENQDLSYEVRVSAQLVPIYAVDKKGNPVFDLKQEEIILFADGKPMAIIYFNGYRVEEQERKTVPVQNSGKSTTPTPVESPARINFIIIDSLVSNIDVLDISESIAMGIIENAPPGDAFIIMESNQIRGFQYIAGPEKDKKKLEKAISKIKKLYQRRRFEVDPGLLHELELVRGNPRQMEIVLHVIEMDRELVTDNRWEYRKDVRTLAQSVANLKYALKTITLPKTIFLISTNPQKEYLGSRAPKESVPVTYYRFLENAAKAINMGGSMFYLINPITYGSKQKRTELQFMTDAGHGKLIHGKSIAEIVENVKKSTSAYYEIAFYPNKKPGEKSRISIKCKRKGIELISIGYSEQPRPYHMMNATEKKLFALDIVNGGNWSRIVAKVGRIKYHSLSKTEPQSTAEIVEINIPPAMQNKPLELILVYIDPDTQEAAIERIEKAMGEKESITITPMSGRQAYFIIIEPQTPLCIYNRVTSGTEAEG